MLATASIPSPARPSSLSPVSSPELGLFHPQSQKLAASYSESYAFTQGQETESYAALLRTAIQLEFGHVSHACSHSSKPPSNILDIACGVYAGWIIGAAQHADFKLAHFTGLDIAPMRLNLQTLPEDIASRITIKKMDILRTPWPIDDNSFDLVRLGHLGSCVPDHRLSDIFDEASRVCAPNGLIEVIDTNASLGFKAHRVSFPPKEAVAEQYKRDILDCDFESDYLPHAELHASVEKRYLSTYPLSAIPSALLLSAKIIDTLPAYSLSAGECSTLAVTNSSPQTQGDRVLTSSKAPQMSTADSRLALARAQTTRHRESVDIYQTDFWAGVSKPPTWRDSEAVWDVFTSTANDNLHIVSALASAFDWHCDFDLSAERQLGRAIADVNKELQAVQTNTLAPKAHASDLERRLRSYDAELAAVQKRLYGVPEDDSRRLWQDLEVCAWLAKPLAASS